MKRRQFIGAASVLAGGMLASRNILGATLAPPLRIRREVSSTAAAHDLALYKKAVAVMKARNSDPNDPRSWNAQAHIHNDHCPHGNWFFLPWHRSYLKHFEDICREACGDPSFNLPYWDWTLHPSLPASFWGTGNILMDTTRENAPTDKLPVEFTGSSVMSVILALDSFEDFGSYRSATQRPPTTVYGQLEGNPHNNVHGFISGNMGNFLSPLDPIFWLHHANVDRTWAAWNDLGHANPTEPAYSSYIFAKNFYGPDKAVINAVKAGDMSDQRSLGYIYDSQATVAAQAQLALTNFKLLTASKISALTANVQLKSLVPESFEVQGIKKINAFTAAPPHNASGPHIKREVKAVISDIVPPEKENFFVRVFLDCPYLSKDTPISDAHYVGSFSFFGSHHVMSSAPGAMPMPHRLSFVFDITNNLKKLKNVKDTDAVKVQLLAVPFKANGQAKLLTGKVDIVVAEKSS